MLAFIKDLPLTRFKIAIARILYRISSLLSINKIQTVTRGGICYELDLSEGIVSCPRSIDLVGA